MLAADAMAKLYEIAKQPGIGMEEAANAYAGLRALKVTGAEAMKVIDGIAKANAAMGGGAEQFGRAMYQIRQAYGKHKLTGEDLKDLSESIPNIAGVIQTAFKGASLEAINAKYSINEVMQKIAEAAKDLPPQGDTIKNNFDNIADSWKHLKAQMADSSVIKAATGALASLLDAMDQRGQKTESRLERLNRMEASKKWSIGLDADSRTSQQHLRDMTKEEREWVETGKYSEKVALAVADAKAKQAAASKQAAEASKAERQSTLTKLQEDVGKTDRVEKIKAENEWYDSQRKILERTKDAAVDAKAELALLDKAHAEHLKKIEKGEPKPKKEKHAERDAADKEAAEMVKRWADVDKWNADQQVKAKKIREEEFQLELKDMQKKDAAQRRLNEAAQRREERDMEVHRKMQEFLWEQEREMEEHNAKMAEGAWMSAASTMQGTFSTAFMEIGKKHGEFMLTLTEGFEGALNKMASDLAANAAIFGILSLIGGPAATFAEGAGGLTGALFGMRATGGSVGGGAYLVGENRPEVFRPTVPGQIHNSTSHTSYGGVTINVHGGGADPKAIAAAVVRAQKIQALGHKATSR
jgi:tape measure domain-containing protein